MVTCMSKIQGPIQGILRPAFWIPGFNRMHSHRERWEMPRDVSPESFIQMVLKAVDDIQGEDSELPGCSKPEYVVHKTNPETGFVRILCYTKAEWLDVVEIHFSSGKVLSFSSGVVPTSVPLGIILNLVAFWCPFYDWGLNQTRLERLRIHLALNLQTDQKPADEGAAATGDDEAPLPSDSPPAAATDTNEVTSSAQSSPLKDPDTTDVPTYGSIPPEAEC